MLLTVDKIWSKVLEFVKRVGDLEGETDLNKKAIEHLRKELQIVGKELDHNDKVQAHFAQKLAECDARIKKLEGEKRGKSISAGIAKKKLEKLEAELRKDN